MTSVYSKMRINSLVGPQCFAVLPVVEGKQVMVPVILVVLSILPRAEVVIVVPTIHVVPVVPVVLAFLLNFEVVAAVLPVVEERVFEGKTELLEDGDQD